MWVYKYNHEFIWQAGEEIEIDIEGNEEIPVGYTDIQPPNELYKAKFDPETKKWSESASQEYIESFQPQPETQPSALEIMEDQIAELYYLLAIGNSGDPS